MYVMNNKLAPFFRISWPIFFRTNVPNKYWIKCDSLLLWYKSSFIMMMMMMMMLILIVIRMMMMILMMMMMMMMMMTTTSRMMIVGINGWVNNREADDFRRHRVHYDVIVMYIFVKNDTTCDRWDDLSQFGAIVQSVFVELDKNTTVHDRNSMWGVIYQM